MATDRRRSFASPYRNAQLAARAQMGALTKRAAKLIQKDLERYADDLARIVRNLPPGAAQLQLTAMRRAVTSAAAHLNVRLTRTIGSFRNLGFDEVLQIWEQSFQQASKVVGLGAVVIPAAPVTMLGAYANLGSAAASWQTLIRSHVANAAGAADQLIRNAIIQQADPSKLARALRPYVVGAEPFHKAFGPLAADGIDLRVLRPHSPELRNAASTMNYNSRRIAFSELNNVRAEAELQHFAADPLVGAVVWTLSIYRGPTGGPDECDVLAMSDFYGLGPGVYPLDAVPLPPHPHDRCERVPVVRPRDQINAPKPLGLEKTGEAKTLKTVTRKKADKLRAHVDSNLLMATQSRASEVVTQLVPPMTTGATDITKSMKHGVGTIGTQYQAIVLSGRKKTLKGRKIAAPTSPKVKAAPSGVRKGTLAKVKAAQSGAKVEATTQAKRRRVDTPPPPKFKTPREMEDWFGEWKADLWIDQSKAVDMKLLNEHATRITEFARNGKGMPSVIRFEDLGKLIAGNYTPESRVLSINIQLVQKSPSHLGPMPITASRMRKNGFWPQQGTATPVLDHEMGHFYHLRTTSTRNLRSWKKAERAMDEAGWTGTMKELGASISKHVSDYAMTEPAEFVAEAYAKMLGGGKLPRELKRLYDALGGPSIIFKQR